MRGGSFNKDDFLTELNILDGKIVDFSPLVTQFEKQYGKQFLSYPIDTVYASVEEKQDGGRVSPDSTWCKLADTEENLLPVLGFPHFLSKLSSLIKA